MTTATSPLRYPGGKQVLAPVLVALIRKNGLEGCAYAEPYAGGAGAALSLLFREYVSRLLLNDADRGVYSFWRSVLFRTDDMLRMVRDTPLTIGQWRRQRSIYRDPKNHSALELGFATFYLNRTNRSGIIINGGPIGGIRQSGKWKIDARFNRPELAKRITRIALYRNRIRVTNKDAVAFIKNDLSTTVPLFLYLDPPYYEKGARLYLNQYATSNHDEIARCMQARPHLRWVMTYDGVPKIRELYRSARCLPFSIDYSASGRKNGNEVLIVSDAMTLPEGWRHRVPAELLTTANVRRTAVHLRR